MIARCGRYDWPTQKRHRCKARGCPFCADYVAREGATRFERALRHFVHAGRVFLLEPRCDGLADLARALDSLRDALGVLREHSCFAMVHGGVVSHEVAWHLSGAPNPHANLALDVSDEAGAFDAGWCNAVLAESGCRVELRPWPQPVVSGRARLARYATKRDTLAPDPAQRTSKQFVALVRALRRRRLVERWGTGRNGMRPDRAKWAPSHRPEYSTRDLYTIGFFDFLTARAGRDRAAGRCPRRPS